MPCSCKFIKFEYFWSFVETSSKTTISELDLLILQALLNFFLIWKGMQFHACMQWKIGFYLIRIEDNDNDFLKVTVLSDHTRDFEF